MVRIKRTYSVCLYVGATHYVYAIESTGPMAALASAIEEHHFDVPIYRRSNGKPREPSIVQRGQFGDKRHYTVAVLHANLESIVYKAEVM